MKTALKDKINSGEIKVINVGTDKEAKRIANLFGGVPTLLEDNDGTLTELELREE